MSGHYENVDGHRVWTERSAVAPAGPETSGEVPADRRDLPAVPDALRDFLRLPEVYVHPDEQRCAVVISMPAYLARGLAELHPNPLQVRLAAQLIEAAEMDAAEAADERRTGWVFQ